MEKFNDKVKCSSIYLNGTVHSSGHIAGGGAGLGIGLGGPGLMVGGGSAHTSSVSSSKLASMFAPFKNPYTDKYEGRHDIYLKKTFTGMIIGIASIRGPEILEYLRLSSPETVGKISILIQLIGGVIALIIMMDALLILTRDPEYVYTPEEMKTLNQNYDKIYYSPKEHVIFISEDHVLPASRDNFLELIKKGNLLKTTGS